MKYLFPLLLLLLQVLFLAAQTEKSATPLSKTGVTRAVIIGISDYQDEKISDLQYAHRDAEAQGETRVAAAPLHDHCQQRGCDGCPDGGGEGTR